MAFASEAALKTLEKYTPQRQAIAELQQTAKEQFQSKVQAGEGQGILAQAQAEAAPGAISAIFGHAHAEGSRAQELLQPALEGSPAFRKAAALEQAAGSERLAKQEANHLADANTQRVAASEIPAFTRQTATNKLISELAKLSQRQSALAGTESLSIGNLEAAARKEQAKEAAAERKEAAKDAFSEKLRGLPTYKDLHPTTKAAAGEVPHLTTAEENKGKGELLKMEQYASEAGRTRAQRVAALTEGQPAQTITHNKSGEKLTNSQKLPGYSGFTPNALMSAALDLVEHGGVTAHTQHLLEAEGYSVKRLGLPSAKAERVPAAGPHGHVG